MAGSSNEKKGYRPIHPFPLTPESGDLVFEHEKVCDLAPCSTMGAHACFSAATAPPSCLLFWVYCRNGTLP